MLGTILLGAKGPLLLPFVRRFSGKKGVVLGVYEGCGGEMKLTDTASRIDVTAGGKLCDFINRRRLERGESYVMSHVPGCEYFAVALVGAGKEDAGYNLMEGLDESRENIRKAAAAGATALYDLKIEDITVEGFSDSEAAAEGACLSLYKYDEMMVRSQKNPSCTVSPHAEADRAGWERGVLKAEAQNIARELEDAPPNHMTPKLFARNTIDILCPYGVKVEVRDMDWLSKMKMNSFLAVGKSSCERPTLVELCYHGGTNDQKPIVLVGKGVTFDSGGVCLKKCPGMMDHKADMAGAAVAVGVFRAVATFGIPVNVTAVLPLCENMPSSTALKPGDVVLGMNGKTIRVQDTSHEGRVILADSLSYAATFKPCLVMNIATLTAGVKTALGSSSTGAFTNSDLVWSELSKAGAVTGDRVWRMPLWEFFKSRVTNFHSVDVNNVALGSGADPCTGAAFLMEFAPQGDFVHLDITGTGMISSGLGYPYLKKGGATGRPVRTVAQFLHQLAYPNTTVPSPPTAPPKE